MSAAQAFAREMDDWEALRLAVHDNAPNLPDVQRAQAAFEDIMVKVQEMRARQNSLTAMRQETTQNGSARTKRWPATPRGSSS